MKITKAKLRELKIFNSLGIAELTSKIFVLYRNQDSGRGGHSASWQVIHIELKTDPDTHWMNHGHKTFYVFNPRQDKEKIRLDVIQWASDKFNILEWEKSPFGDYHPKGDIEKAVSKRNENDQKDKKNNNRA